MTKNTWMGGASAAVVLAMAGLGSPAGAAETLTFIWHAGTCADAVVDIAKDYPDKNVTIVPALVPYGPEWHNKIDPASVNAWTRGIETSAAPRVFIEGTDDFYVRN